jgi:hypothetical protein
MGNDWILNYGFFEMRFFDLPNLFVCLLFLLYLVKKLSLPFAERVVLFLHCILPIFLNGFLFEFDYMPDAFKYWQAVNDLRSGSASFLDLWVSGSNVEQASVLLSIVPLPFAFTPMSLGFYNTFIYLWLFYWLVKKRILTPVSTWFYLLYPSLALYSGMGLRDTLIFAGMAIAIQFSREGKWVFSIPALIILYVIKFQNFYILGPLLLVYVAFDVRKYGLSVGRGLVAIAIGLLAAVTLAPILLPIMNVFRLAMYREDGGNASEIELIETPSEFLLEGASSGLYFLLKPFPWEASNAFQFIQSIENALVFLLLLLISRVAWLHAPRKLVYWVLFLAFSLTVYGLVVFNYGTAARYRFSFLAVYVIFVCADCRVNGIFMRSRMGERARCLTAENSSV